MSKKIKVLQMFGEPISYGGQEAVVFNMISALGFDSFSFDYFTPYHIDNHKMIELINNEKNDYSNNKSEHIFNMNLEAKVNDNRFLIKKDIEKYFSNDILKNYDVVHIHTGSLSTMCILAEIAKKYNVKKIIVHSHSAGYKESIKHKLLKTILNLNLQKNANYFLACSDEAAKWKYSLSTLKKTKIVLNGIDIEKFKFNLDNRNYIRNKYNIGNDFLIAQVGRLAYPKNQKYGIDILRLCLKSNNHIKLMLVGDGPDKESLLQYIYDKNIQDKVILVDSTNEIYKYYSAFDCFIMPSIYEGLGITAVEAQVAKTPSLLSTQVNKECFISNASIFLDLNKIDDWVKIILDIKANKNDLYNRDNITVDFSKFDRRYTYELVRNIYLKDEK